MLDNVFANCSSPPPLSLPQLYAASLLVEAPSPFSICAPLETPHGGECLQGGQVTHCPSVKQGHQVMALFQLPSLTNQYRSKADEYLSHLVGHEGKGSLLSALKAKGWASELSAGVGESGYDRNTAAYVFEVHINLSQAGFEASPGAHPCKLAVGRGWRAQGGEGFSCLRFQSVCTLHGSQLDCVLRTKAFIIHSAFSPK